MNRGEFIIHCAGLFVLGSFSMAALAHDPEKANKKFTVISKRCDGCGHCFRSCRDKALLETNDGKAFIDQQKCKGCGDCIRFCRRMAIVEIDNS